MFTFVYASIACPDKPSVYHVLAIDTADAVARFEMRHNMHVIAYAFYRDGSHDMRAFHATREAWTTLKTGGR